MSNQEPTTQMNVQSRYSWFYGFVLAVQLFTRIPLPITAPWEPVTMKWAIRFLPMIGLMIGSMLGTCAFMFSEHIPTILLTLLLLTIWVVLTGGLHIDGWMDMFDALGANAPVEKKWKIMKDPRVGSFAVLALILLLLWKGTLIYLLLQDVGVTNKLLLFSVLIIIPSFARLGGIAMLILFPVAKQEGLAWEFKKHVSYQDMFLSSTTLILISLTMTLLSIPDSHTALFFMLILTIALIPYMIFFARRIVRTFQGVNGDLIGAAIEGGEGWLSVVLWSYIWFVMV